MDIHFILQSLMYGFHLFAILYILKFIPQFVKLYDLVAEDATDPTDLEIRLRFLQNSYRDLKVLAIILFTQAVVIFCYFFFAH